MSHLPDGNAEVAFVSGLRGVAVVLAELSILGRLRTIKVDFGLALILAFGLALGLVNGLANKLLNNLLAWVCCARPARAKLSNQRRLIAFNIRYSQ